MFDPRTHTAWWPRIFDKGTVCLWAYVVRCLDRCVGMRASVPVLVTDGSGALVAVGRIMIGLTASFKRIRGRMSLRDAFVGLVVMVFTATLGCVCLAGVQPDAKSSPADGVAASVSHSHHDHGQEPTGTDDIVSSGASGGASGGLHSCCIDEHSRDSTKSEQEVRLLAPDLKAVPPDTAMDIPADNAPAVTFFHMQSAAVKPPSLVQLSISRT